MWSDELPMHADELRITFSGEEQRAHGQAWRYDLPVTPGTTDIVASCCTNMPATAAVHVLA
jgi:hypothetical protein